MEKNTSDLGPVALSWIAEFRNMTCNGYLWSIVFFSRIYDMNDKRSWVENESQID